MHCSQIFYFSSPIYNVLRVNTSTCSPHSELRSLFSHAQKAWALRSSLKDASSEPWQLSTQHRVQEEYNKPENSVAVSRIWCSTASYLPIQFCGSFTGHKLLCISYTAYLEPGDTRAILNDSMIQILHWKDNILTGSHKIPCLYETPMFIAMFIKVRMAWH
jgi:hypothetical protein